MVYFTADIPRHASRHPFGDGQPAENNTLPRTPHIMMPSQGSSRQRSCMCHVQVFYLNLSVLSGIAELPLRHAITGDILHDGRYVPLLAIYRGDPASGQLSFGQMTHVFEELAR